MINQISETQINEILIKGLRLHKELLKEHRKELANQVLAFTSSLADLLLNVSSVRRNYRRVFCQTCGKNLTNGKEIEFYNKVGECPSCDHNRGEYQAERNMEDSLVFEKTEVEQ